jgi:hypothetical protein
MEEDNLTMRRNAEMARPCQPRCNRGSRSSTWLLLKVLTFVPDIESEMGLSQNGL